MKSSSFVIAFAQAALLAALPSHASGGGGGVDGPNPLPTTPPAPGVVLRESFGGGPLYARPEGDKGRLREVFAGQHLSSFWVEYPGSWSNAWKGPAGAAWNFAGCSEDPFEVLLTPLQTPPANGCIVSAWRDGLIAFPTALVRLPTLNTAYEVSADLYPAVPQGTSVSIGLTASTVLTSNLSTSGQVFLTLSQGSNPTGFEASYELRAGGVSGTLLAAGTFFLNGFNPVSLRVDPSTQTVSATINGVALGTFVVPGVAPSYLAIEGQGIADNLIVRTVP